MGASFMPCAVRLAEQQQIRAVAPGGRCGGRHAVTVATAGREAALPRGAGGWGRLLRRLPLHQHAAQDLTRRRLGNLVDELDVPDALAGARRRSATHAMARRRSSRETPRRTSAPRSEGDLAASSSAFRTTAASRTAGCVSRSASSSAGATWSPLYLISSFGTVHDVEPVLVVDIADIAGVVPAFLVDASAVSRGRLRYPRMISGPRIRIARMAARQHGPVTRSTILTSM